MAPWPLPVTERLFVYSCGVGESTNGGDNVADETAVSVVARIQAREGMEQRLKEEASKLVEPTRSEEGCLNYDLHQGIDDPSVLFF